MLIANQQQTMSTTMSESIPTLTIDKFATNCFKSILQMEGYRIVRELSSKFNFDFDEGLALLNYDKLVIDKEAKSTKNRKGPKLPRDSNESTASAVSKVSKKSNSSKIPLPFCGKKITGNCDAIRLNHGLYTQCTNLSTEQILDTFDGEEIALCKTCKAQVDNNPNHKPTYGYVYDRIKMGNDFKDPKGKSPVNYGNIMKKLDISMDEAIMEAEKLDFTIPSEQFDLKVGKRGRPKKTEQTQQETTKPKNTEPAKPKKRGRPKKSTVVSDSDSESSIIDMEKLKETVKAQEPVFDAFNDKSNVDNSEEEEEEEEEEEAVGVVEFEFNGIRYLKAHDNTLYDIKTHLEIGRFDETDGVILEVDSDDD